MQSPVRIFLLSYFIILSVAGISAQVLTPTLDTIPEKDDRLIIENSGSRIVESSDTGRIQYLYKNVKAYSDSTYFYADTAILTDNFLIAYGNMVILQGDTIRLFGDSLYYNRDSSIAEVYGDVILENGDQRLSGNSLFYRTEDKIAYYSDTAILEQGTMKLQSKNGRFLINEKIGYFDRDVILIDGDTRLRTHSMIYYTNEEKAEFIAPTRIKTIDAEIYCEEGFYQLKDGIGVFTINAQYKGDDRSVVGDEIQYNKIEDYIKVIGNAVFTSENADGISDEMEYSEQTGDLVLIGQAILQDTSATIGGERITFNQDSKDLFIAGNGFLWKDDWSLTATNIAYNDTSGAGMADGDVIYIDSTSQTYLYCDEASFDNSTQYMKAFNYNSRPYLRMISENDTTVISSDTIHSYQLIDTLFTPVDTLYIPIERVMLSDSTGNTIDSIDLKHTVQEIDSTSISLDSTESRVIYDTTYNARKFLVADENVGVFSKDMQAICDSFTFNMADSTFVLIGGPVMWSDTTQFSGDTIYLIQANNKLDKMIIEGNVMIINSINPFFNQIKGKRLEGFFLDEELDRFMVEGSSQSVYYMADDKNAFIGVNKTDCSMLKFNFENNEISDIRGYTDVKSKLIPIEKADHEGLKLAGFKWTIEKRPTKEEDVINM